jgi:hypothetical protein
MYLTPNQSERDSATGLRMIFEIFGVLLSAGIQGLMISIYGSIFSCDDATTTAPIITSAFNQTTNFITTQKPGYNKLVRLYYYLFFNIDVNFKG